MPRYAAVDCGTNSIRLLISEVLPDGKIRDVTRLMEIIRLGEGVDATGRISDAAIARARAALSNFVEQMRFENVTAVRMVATSASRDAENRQEFFDMTAELLGQIQPGAMAEVIFGAEEAQLSFRGAVGDLSPDKGPFCVIDLGGGSTEFIVGDHTGDIHGAYSARMGCVRLTERFLPTDPATPDELAAARDYVSAQLADVAKTVPLQDARTFVGCAGTFTTLSALAQGLEKYDPDAIHGSIVRFGALRVLLDHLVKQPAASRALNPVIHPGRADVIGGGAVAVHGIMDLIGDATDTNSFVISEKDILDGIIAGIVDAAQ
ncbi:Ppx/GppA family phosphatase [Corynebacterium incognita]|uniref:Ppx/GppA family phosphatase n=1 Tax=Corynebacterium incognita TaxID=2754725 RepID=A0A7G7CNU2_9CORY|nr:Ppx/GppA phosphatase family protein [Corynebacterium incognita]QNE89258.1 Ppx/GppA family phosphatase [Corynebacterium incognita]